MLPENNKTLDCFFLCLFYLIHEYPSTNNLPRRESEISPGTSTHQEQPRDGYHPDRSGTVCNKDGNRGHGNFLDFPCVLSLTRRVI